MTFSLKEAFDVAVENVLYNTHTALPAIITAFDREEQTVTVRLSIKRNIGGESVEIAPIIDIPVVQPSAGGFHITLPIKAGDECLVIFAERAIDTWFEHGGVQAPAERRRHDISDGFAIIGVNSKPNGIPHYNIHGLDIRNEEKTQHITLHGDGDIEIYTANTLNINTVGSVNIISGHHVNISTQDNATITSGRDTRVLAVGEISLTAPLIKLLGNVEITGNMVQVGTFTLNGITVDAHIHAGDSGGSTGPMQ